jgi:hypothetical protein
VHPTSSGTTSKHRRRAGGRGVSTGQAGGSGAGGSRGTEGAWEHTQSAASEANDTGRRGGRAPVTHVGTIARHRRAAITGQNGDGKGEGGAPQQGSSRPLTATRRSPPRHSSREAARRAGGNDTGQAGDTEASCSGSGRRAAEGTNCKGTRWGRGAGPPRRPSRAGGAQALGSGARHQGAGGGRNCRRPFSVKKKGCVVGMRPSQAAGARSRA